MTRLHKLAIACLIIFFSSHCLAECLSYEPDSVSLTGKVIRKTFPGRPNYESIKDGDEPETHWLLIPAQPFCVKAKQGDPQYASESGIKEVQLVFMNDEYRRHKDLVGKNIMATGRLFPMQTGHHHTRVLLLVKKMRKSQSDLP